jgi:hypothetical protein
LKQEIVGWLFHGNDHETSHSAARKKYEEQESGSPRVKNMLGGRTSKTRSYGSMEFLGVGKLFFGTVRRPSITRQH